MPRRVKTTVQPPVRDSWQQEFHRRMIAALMAEGNPVAQGDDRDLFYGGFAYDWQELTEHFASCGVNYDETSFTEGNWREFAGTFADPGDENRSGIVLTATCNCGKYSGRRWRYENSYGNLLRRLTGE